MRQNSALRALCTLLRSVEEENLGFLAQTRPHRWLHHQLPAAKLMDPVLARSPDLKTITLSLAAPFILKQVASVTSYHMPLPLPRL